MTKCKHINKYIQKTKGFSRIEPFFHVRMLITYCADCGETLKTVEIK